jgi:ribose/xylose/arabinose/galactoside ABC-type transport system permease subunit
VFLNYGTLIGFAAVFAVFGIIEPSFLTLSNLLMGLRQMAILFLMGLAATFVLVEGGLDLSIGSVVGMGTVLVCGLQKSGTSVIIAILVVLITSAAIGFANAVNIVLLGVPPFIATIAMMFIIQGLELVYSGGRVITTGIQGSFKFLGQGWIGPIPFLVVIILVIAFVAYILMSKTKFGRYAYAVGKNKTAVYLSGVSTSKYRILLYVLTGMIGGLAGIMLGSRLGSAPVWAGQKLLLPAFAAAYLGASTNKEGEFGVFQTLLGAFLINGLNNGLSLIGYGWYWQQILLGIVLLLSVSVSGLRKKA